MRSALRAACFLGLAAIPGCANAPPVPTRQLVAGPCGVAIEFWWVEAVALRYEFFQVNDGTLGYGGGADGLSRTPTWWVDLSPAQCAELSQQCRALGWFTAPPEAVDGGTRVELIVQDGEGHGGWKVASSQPLMLRLKAWLDAVVRTRFDGAIRKLPEGSG